MSQHRALLDANVLYPAPLRDIFLQLAVMDSFKAKWTAEIHREWIEALLRNDPQRDRAALQFASRREQSLPRCATIRSGTERRLRERES